MASRLRVTDGGFMSTKRATFSKETQELMKTLMKESQLTVMQQRKINERMSRGEDLPVGELTKKPSRAQRHQGKGSSRVGVAGRPGLRSADTIKQLETQQHNTQYTPTRPNYNSTVEKERLHNIMAYGKAHVDQEVCVKQPSLEGLAEMDRFEEILSEIQERQEFLNEMSQLGQEGQYKAIVGTEISQKIRELEEIDRERTKRVVDLQYEPM